MTANDPGAVERATRLMNTVNESLRTMSPQERDRRMQILLAQARGPVRNAMLLTQMTAMLLRARQIARAKEEGDVHEPNP